MDASLLADFEFWLELLSAWRINTKSKIAKQAANVAMMAIKAFLGFDFFQKNFLIKKDKAKAIAEKTNMFWMMSFIIK